MRKVILSMMGSPDGFLEGPDKELHRHVWDDEIEKDVHQTLDKERW